MGQDYAIELIQLLATRFDREELRTLCYSAGVDYDDLPAQGKANKARELVRYLERRDQIPMLLEIGQQMRPDIAWPAPPATPPRPTPFPTPRPWYRQTRMRWGVAAALALVAAVAVLSLLILPNAGKEAPAGGVPTAAPDEIMILIAQFKAQMGSERYDVSQRLYDKLSDDLRQLGEEEVTVYQVPDIVESSEQAIALGQRYGATTVIWGFYDDAGISPNLEAVGKPADSPLSVGLEMMNLDVGDAVNFRLYIARDMPKELSFLTAVALLQAFILQGRGDRALVYLAMAERNLPADPQFRGGGEMVYFSQAIMALTLGDLQGAVERINQAISIKPDRALYFVVRGLLYFRSEDTARALADLDRAIALDPASALAYLMKGTILWQEGDDQAALSLLNQAVELGAESMDVYYSLGMLHFEMGDLNQALTGLNAVEALDPGSRFLPILRGLVYEKMGRSEQAALDYAWAIERGIPPAAFIQYSSFIWGERMPALPYLFECTSHQVWGEIEQALASCDKALEVDPGYFDALWKRGQLYAARGEIEAALTDYTNAIQADPRWPWVYFLRAQALVSAGRIEEAHVDLARAQELDPTDELRQQIEAFQK